MTWECGPINLTQRGRRLIRKHHVFTCAQNKAFSLRKTDPYHLVGESIYLVGDGISLEINGREKRRKRRKREEEETN